MQNLISMSYALTNVGGTLNIGALPPPYVGAWLTVTTFPSHYHAKFDRDKRRETDAECPKTLPLGKIKYLDPENLVRIRP